LTTQVRGDITTMRLDGIIDDDVQVGARLRCARRAAYAPAAPPRALPAASV
jgi:hypothetical protein